MRGKKQQIFFFKKSQEPCRVLHLFLRLTCDRRIATHVLNLSYLIIYCANTVVLWDVPPHSGNIYSNVLVSSRRLLGMNECFSVLLGCCSRIPECVSLNALLLSPESFLKIIRLITGSGYIYRCFLFAFVCFLFPTHLKLFNISASFLPLTRSPSLDRPAFVSSVGLGAEYM